jgi:hypothetical protein
MSVAQQLQCAMGSASTPVRVCVKAAQPGQSSGVSNPKKLRSDAPNSHRPGGASSQLVWCRWGCVVLFAGLMTQAPAAARFAPGGTKPPL